MSTSQGSETPRGTPTPHQNIPSTPQTKASLSTKKRKPKETTPDENISVKRQKNSNDPDSSSPRKSSTSVSQPQDTQETPEPDPRPYTKHPRFWALDGNVLLQINTVRFRLHRGRLASQSVWFEKLFVRHIEWPEVVAYAADDTDITQVDEIKAEVVDELDIFFLDSTNVTVGDFEALLIALEDSIVYYYTPPTFPTVAAVFRAAAFFHFENLFQFCKKFLEGTFTQDLISVSKTNIEYAAEAVVLGREWDLPLILKRAFYELARKEVDCQDDDTNPGSTPDDTNSEENEDADEGEAVAEGAINQLCPADLVRLANGRVHLTNAWISAISFKAYTCSDACGATRAPWKLFHVPDDDTGKNFIQKYQCDPVRGLYKLDSVDWKANGYCDACIDTRRKSLRLQRAQIWRNVDTWFELN